MERIFQYHITDAEQGLRVDQLLKQYEYSSRLLTLLRQTLQYVSINNTPSRLADTLSSGDCLTVRIPEESPSAHIPPVELPLSILYEDEDILVVNKPAGMPIHPSMDNYENSLANGLAWYYASRGETFVFRCTNRLDKDTSGLTVIAKHMLSASILSAMSACHALKREYLAIVRGHIMPEAGTITAPLSRKEGSIIERCVDFEHGEHAVTHYQFLEEKNGHSLIHLVLETGRTHQIRLHMKHLGYPLIGDYLYNPDMTFINRQALHSHKLSFLHPITKKPLTFTAPLPADMQAVLKETDDTEMK